MVTTLPSSYPPLNESSNEESPHIPDTEELAGFLLTLKHRSVTPDPHSSDRSQKVVSSRKAPLSSFNQSTSDSPYVETSSASSVNGSSMSDESSRVGSAGEISMPWEQLLGDSKLVTMEDRDLVPDCLFVAMAQMKPCRLQPTDRGGCYKSREIGFIGMACKHCGGQPGFGRYFPNSVRSLAQTTTSQTIL